ncbi:membrane protein PM19L-like [Cornus florida]|uniref:membrane protein PM19L-like n=1 Tax=Cornus florida TaxID=4283 RepID=UPI00289F5A69|nr:membrane protein PM19L-like [Cornus florida]
MVAGRSCISRMEPLLVVNFVVYLVILGLAAWSLDKYINGEQNHPHLGGNESTSFMLIYALTAGVTGVCSVLAGLIHLRAWRSDSLASAASSALISWAITALAFGLVCKEIILGGHRGKRLQTLEAFIAISTLSQFLYLVILHAGLYSNRYGPFYRGNEAQYGSTSIVV